jgi:hypothetical protein
MTNHRYSLEEILESAKSELFLLSILYTDWHDLLFLFIFEGINVQCCPFHNLKAVDCVNTPVNVNLVPSLLTLVFLPLFNLDIL